MSDVIIGALVGIAGLLGLVLAAGALDKGMYTFGLGLAAFAVFYVCFLVKRHYDSVDRGARS